MRISTSVFLVMASSMVFACLCKCYGTTGTSGSYVYGRGGETEWKDAGGGRMIPATLPWGGEIGYDYSCDNKSAESYINSSAVASPSEWTGGRGWSGTLRCAVGGTVSVYWEREYESGKEVYSESVSWGSGQWRTEKRRGGCVVSEEWAGGDLGSEYVCGGEHVRSYGGVVHSCTSSYEYGGCYLSAGTLGMEP